MDVGVIRVATGQLDPVDRSGIIEVDNQVGIVTESARVPGDFDIDEGRPGKQRNIIVIGTDVRDGDVDAVAAVDDGVRREAV